MRSLLVALALLVCAAATRAADPYSIKVVDAAPPQEVAVPTRALLGNRCVRLLDGPGDALAELWFRKELPARATEAQVRNGLTYDEVPETSVLAVMRLVRPMTDYRKQTIPPGVYTLRLAFQPRTGDHGGTAPYTEFALLSKAADDKSPELMEAKGLHEMSARVPEKHPSPWLLFPGRDVTEPKLAPKGDGHWVLMWRQDVVVGSTRTTMVIGLTLIGTSPSA